MTPYLINFLYDSFQGGQMTVKALGHLVVNACIMYWARSLHMCIPFKDPVFA